jgi:hypothetical protein
MALMRQLVFLGPGRLKWQEALETQTMCSWNCLQPGRVLPPLPVAEIATVNAEDALSVGGCEERSGLDHQAAG